MALRKIEIEAELALDDKKVTTLLELAQALYDSVPLSTIEVTRMASGSGWTFTYEIRAADDRTWTQTILFPATVDPDPPMTFDVPEGWRRVAEFQHARGLRNHIIDMINNAGLIRLLIEWEP